jgi:hypothetical protein
MIEERPEEIEGFGIKKGIVLARTEPLLTLGKVQRSLE